MKLFFLLPLLYFHVSLFANSYEKALDFFENELSFKQISFNKFSNNYDESLGNYTHNSNSIQIEITSPFKEIYFINNYGVEIHDLEFNQIKVISKDELKDNLIFNLFIQNTADDKVELIDDSTFLIYENKIPYFFNFIDNETLEIKYKDNMEIDNLITFTKNQ